jgi:NADH-quinone oxidoreductase subunit J
MTTVLFYVLAGLTAASALAVVVTQNIVRAATCLLFTLGGVAGIFFLLGADFVGATQLLVYVGGTLVLVVFGVMLTAQGPFINMRIGAAEWLIALAAGLMLFGVLAISVVGVQTPEDYKPHAMAPSKQLGAALLGDERSTPEALLPQREGAPEAEARDRSRMSYLLPFEIVSVHLLVVLIGAAYLARAKKRMKAEV